MSILRDDIRVAVPESTFIDGRDNSQFTAGLVINAEYTNYTQTMIYAKTQANVPFAMDPALNLISASEPRSHIEIKITYKIMNNAGILGTLEMLRALHENDHLQSYEAQHLMEKVNALYKNNGSRSSKTNFVFTVFRRIMESELDRTRALYFKECDLILTKEREMLIKPHPNSSLGLQESELFGLRRDAGQAGVFIKVVDNDRLTDVRYYVAAKQLIAVPSVIDLTCESGVYYTIATLLENGTVEPVTKHVSFEEAEELLGLYRYKESATSNGNPDLALKAEEKRLALALARERSENERRSAESERKILQLKHDLEAQKLANDGLRENMALGKVVREDVSDKKKKKREKKKAEQEVIQAREQMRLDIERKLRDDYYDRRDKDRKDYYEERSTERKDTSEMIKFIPAVILGIVGTIAIMRSQK